MKKNHKASGGKADAFLPESFVFCRATKKMHAFMRRTLCCSLFVYDDMSVKSEFCHLHHMIGFIMKIR